MRLRCRRALAVTTATVMTAAVASAASASPATTGFGKPYAGAKKYERYAPTQATNPHQINQPLGTRAAHRVAKGLGLSKKHVFTKRQYRLFISGKGAGGDPTAATLVDESVRILTNTTGRPLISDVDGRRTATVLASYGLMVNTQGMLQSPANAAAPTRQVNSVLAPGGYMPTWCRNNGARASLRMLYRSAFTPEAVYSNKSQTAAGVAQLVSTSRHGSTTTVGMSMVPALWNVNFSLIYMLKPSLAAKMPARWTPIPDDVAQAIEDSPTGQVPYSEYASSLPQ